MANDKIISELTPEQMALLPIYREKFKALGLSTDPIDKAKAEAAVLRAYEYLYKQGKSTNPAPEFVWAESPMKGIVLAAKLQKGSDKVTNEEIQALASAASYASFEAYWASTYLFIAKELPVKVDEVADIVLDIITHCGVYWTFDDIVVMTPKPCRIEIKDDKLHSVTGPALQYANGDGVYAVNGERKSSLIEVIMTVRNDEKP